MRLLIVTQAVDKNDPVLGFFHRWIEEFAKHFEKITVICLRLGDHDLPENVSVHSLGKETARGPRLFRILRYIAVFLRHIIHLRREHDAVFVHMNAEYVVLGGLLWRLWGKRVGLWYLHKSVTFRLRAAHALADVIFTAAPSGFRIRSRKVKVLGHGIDTDRFAGITRTPRGDHVRVLTVGRIAPVKNLELQFDALTEVAQRGTRITFTVVGGPVMASDKTYESSLRKRATTLPFRVIFAGTVPHADVPPFFARADVFLNTSRTGGVDKAVLEAMAAGLPVATTNCAFDGIVPDELIAAEDSASLAQSVERAVGYDGISLRHIVSAHHSLSWLIERIAASYERR